jgi:hypothetical protein
MPSTQVVSLGRSLPDCAPPLTRTRHWGLDPTPPRRQAIEMFEAWERRTVRLHPGRCPFHRYRPPGGAAASAGVDNNAGAPRAVEPAAGYGTEAAAAVSAVSGAVAAAPAAAGKQTAAAAVAAATHAVEAAGAAVLGALPRKIDVFRDFPDLVGAWPWFRHLPAAAGAMLARGALQFVVKQAGLHRRARASNHTRKPFFAGDCRRHSKRQPPIPYHARNPTPPSLAPSPRPRSASPLPTWRAITWMRPPRRAGCQG